MAHWKIEKIKEQKPLKSVWEYSSQLSRRCHKPTINIRRSNCSFTWKACANSANRQAHPTQPPCSLAQERDSKISQSGRPKLARQSGKADVSHIHHKSAKRFLWLWSKHKFKSLLWSRVSFYTAANVHCITVKHCFIESLNTGPEKKSLWALQKPKHPNQKCCLSNGRRKDLQILLKFMAGDDFLYARITQPNTLWYKKSIALKHV